MSEKINDGGRAFPLHPGVLADWNDSNGMSLRDWFAGQALPGGIQVCQADTIRQKGEDYASYCAKRAYQQADAMIAVQGLGEPDALRARVAELEAAISAADDALYEVNMGNYDDEEVSRLNAGSIEASGILRAALAKTERNAPDGAA